MHVIADSAKLTAEQRRSELDSILAAGFLRHRSRRGHMPPLRHAQGKPPGRADEEGSTSSARLFARRLSESTGGVRRNEEQCLPRTDNHGARKGQRAWLSTRLMPRSGALPEGPPPWSG